MKRKINIRLAFIAVLAIIATTLVITSVYYNLFQGQVRSDLKQNAQLLVETEVFQKAYDSGKGDFEDLKNFSFGKLRITWIDTDGTVLFDNDTNITGLSNHLDRPEIKMALEYGEGESVRRSDTMKMNTFYYALLLENGTVLRVSTQAQTIVSVLLTALPVMAGIMVVVLIGCVLIGHLLTRQLMKPIEEMAEHLDDGNSVPAYKELEPFADKIRSQHENILAAAKSRQDFTANVTHELKTPITAISGYAELIENKLIDEDEQVHAAAKIRQNANRLLSLVTDIIQLSELDHKELPRKFEQIDLFAVAKECVKENEPLAAQKNVRLTYSGVSAGIKADKSLIREMIDNLVQNALRYNKDNGTATVIVTIENGHPIVTVEDTGIGIPSDQTKRVFERFYRVDKSRSRATGGTGLGLAIVKHIAEIHSADIDLESELGVGTKISVKF